MGLPESHFCEEHKRTHKKGSAIYDSCLSAFTGAAEAEEPEEPEAEELEAEEAELEAEEEKEKEKEEVEEDEEEPEPEPESKPKKAHVPPTKAGPGEVLFRFKDDMPGTVSVRTGSIDKTFSRTMQPFLADAVIFEKVLLRTGFFEKA
jgi:hypothetical protein